MEKNVKEIYKMGNKFKKKVISIIVSLFAFAIYGQKTPNIEGEYYLPNNKAGLYIYDKNKFLVVGYATAIKGQVEIINNALKFKSDHPNSEIILYGRSSLNKRLILGEDIFREDIYFGDNFKKNNSLINIQREKDYCSSYKYFLPLNNVINVVFKSGNDNFLTYYEPHKKYSEFLIGYLKADNDISFLNDVFLLKDGQLNFDSQIKKKPLSFDKNNEYVKKIINDINTADAFFNKDIIYLDENYDVIANEKVDLSQYIYDADKDEYYRRNANKSATDLNVLYQFSKIKITGVYKDFKLNSDQVLKAKCLKNPRVIFEENQREKIKDKTLEVLPMQPMKME